MTGHTSLTVAEIRAQVAHIATIGPWDDEAGHTMEDRLHQNTLRAIAAGAADPAALATAALATTMIKFERWGG